MYESRMTDYTSRPSAAGGAGGLRRPGGGVGRSAAISRSPATASSSKRACSGYSASVASIVHISSSSSVVNCAVHAAGRMSSKGDDLRPAPLFIRYLSHDCSGFRLDT